jgi:hypothetical protein
VIVYAALPVEVLNSLASCGSSGSQMRKAVVLKNPAEARRRIARVPVGSRREAGTVSTA